MEYPEYLKLSDMRAPVAEPDAVYVAPVKRKVEKQKQKPQAEKPQAEIRAIPANKRPLEWQLQTVGEYYDALHNRVKDAWDTYLISPETVKDAHDYYENELLYEDFPGAVPLAAIGSTLSGEAYDFWRDLQTDPANLVGGELLRGGKKVSEVLGAIKYGSKPRQYAKAAFTTTMDDMERLVAQRNTALKKAAEKGYDIQREITKNEAEGFIKDINAHLGSGKVDKDIAYTVREGAPYKTSNFENLPESGAPIFYTEGGRQPFNVEYNARPRGEYKSDLTHAKIRPLDEELLDEPIYRGQIADVNTPLDIMSDVGIRRGTFSDDLATGSVENTHWYAPGKYATPSIEEGGEYARMGMLLDEGNKLRTINRVITPDRPTFANTIESYRTFSTTPSVEARQKLITLFGEEIATDPVLRNTPLHNLIIDPNAKNASEFYDELYDLGINRVRHKEGSTSFSHPRDVLIGSHQNVPIFIPANSDHGYGLTYDFASLTKKPMPILNSDGSPALLSPIDILDQPVGKLSNEDMRAWLRILAGK